MTKKPKRANLRPPGKCIFCGGGPVTLEHIWSEWTYHYVPVNPNIKHTRFHARSGKGSPNILGLTDDRAYPGSVNTRKMRVVCRIRCNSGWMSDVEDAAKPHLIPLLTGRRATLTMYQQKLVATWFTMKAMVTEFNDPALVASTAEERERVMLYREPPASWRIWMARHDTFEWTNSYFRNAATLGNLDAQGVYVTPDGSFSKNTQIIALGIGEVVFVAVSTRVPNVGFKVPLESQHVLRQIWPYKSDIIWPPLAALTGAGVHNMISALDRFLNSIPWQRPYPE